MSMSSLHKTTSRAVLYPDILLAIILQGEKRSSSPSLVLERVIGLDLPSDRSWAVDERKLGHVQAGECWGSEVEWAGF